MYLLLNIGFFVITGIALTNHHLDSFYYQEIVQLLVQEVLKVYIIIRYFVHLKHDENKQCWLRHIND